MNVYWLAVLKTTNHHLHVIFETFGYIDPRSRRTLDRIIKLAATNMNTNVVKIKTSIYTKIGISLTKSDAQAGIARYLIIIIIKLYIT